MKTCPVCDTDYPDQHTNCDTDGAVLIVSRELAPGSLVRGKYRIIRKLGQGGMGVVYLAEDSLLGVKVALKFLAGDLGKDPRFIKRFRTEARAAYQLRHPNIAEVTNLDQAEDGSLFIAMEYVEGPSLRAVLDQNPKGLAIPRALEIAKGIASGLAAAHAQGTIHRDIKPENILITRAADGSERAKVLDFGIAAVAESVTRMTRTQGFILTYAYAAPEQWQEMPADQMDGRTDLYALGCVLYEMLTGTAPFHAHTTAGWMKQHCEESPKPPSTLRPELSEWANLDALLSFLLAKDRNRRPRDVTDMLGLLATVQRNSASRSQPQPQPQSAENVKPRQTVPESVVVPATPVIPHSPPIFTPEQSPSIRVQQPVQSRALDDFRASRIHLWVWRGIGVLALAAFVTFWWLGRPRPGPVAELADIPHQQSPASSPAASNQAPSMPAIEQQAEALDKPGSYADALPLFDQACTGGVPTACMKLGYMYEKARGVSKDYSRARILYAKACDGGNMLGCNNLGDLYYYGHGVAKSVSRAATLYVKACDGGSPVGCANLGYSLDKGIGIAKDPFRAAKAYTKSCDSGNPNGCNGFRNDVRVRRRCSQGRFSS